MCNGRDLREVNPVVDDDGGKVSCWLVSEPGKVSGVIHA